MTSRILWQQPDLTLALTEVIDTIDANQYALDLQTQGDIPADWIVLGIEISWATDARWKQETYRWDGAQVVVDLLAAQEETKEKLRGERIPLLQQLDIDYLQALEQALDTTAIIAEKQRLRDITILDPNLTLDQLFNLHC